MQIYARFLQRWIVSEPDPNATFDTALHVFHFNGTAWGQVHPSLTLPGPTNTTFIVQATAPGQMFVAVGDRLFETNQGAWQAQTLPVAPASAAVVQITTDPTGGVWALRTTLDGSGYNDILYDANGTWTIYGIVQPGK